jgi:hypothetical protein
MSHRLADKYGRVGPGRGHLFGDVLDSIDSQIITVV